MKKIFKQLLITSALMSSSLVQASDIHFEIMAIKNNSGKIYIELFKGEENYKQGLAENSSAVKAEKGTKNIVFNDLQAGEYAVRFYHDENNNGELETNLFGIPIEGYGFSNDAKPNFGPVSYSEIKFLVSESDATVKNKAAVIY